MPIQGLQFTIPTGTEKHQSYQATGSFVVYNPNDGVCFVATDRTATLLSWDYKIPSQSGGKFPGPINSYLSIMYVDQSGAGTDGQVVIYASTEQIEIPSFWSIGRSIQSQVTSLDIQQGTQPGNPGAGITRVWSDTSGNVYHLISTGVNCEFLDTCNYTPLITSLTGPVGIVNSLQVSARIIAGTDPGGGTNGDIIANRGGASPGQGVIYFGNSGGTHFLSFAGSFSLTDSLSITGGLTTSAASNMVGLSVTSSGGGISLQATGAPNNWSEAIVSANSGAQYGLLIEAGASSSDYSLYVYNRAQTLTQMYIRGDGFLSIGNGAQLQIQSGASGVINFGTPLVQLGASNSANAAIALLTSVGAKISIYDIGGGSFYGFGINSAEMYISATTNSSLARRLGSAGATVYGIVQTGNYTAGSNQRLESGTTFFNAIGAGVTQITVSFATPFTATPTCVCTLDTISGGVANTHLMHVSINSRAAGSFVIAVDNQTGGSQSVTVDWLAMGASS